MRAGPTGVVGVSAISQSVGAHSPICPLGSRSRLRRDLPLLLPRELGDAEVQVTMSPLWRTPAAQRQQLSTTLGARTREPQTRFSRRTPLVATPGAEPPVPGARSDAQALASLVASVAVDGPRRAWLAVLGLRMGGRAGARTLPSGPSRAGAGASGALLRGGRWDRGHRGRAGGRRERHLCRPRPARLCHGPTQRGAQPGRGSVDNGQSPRSSRRRAGAAGG